jgi:hypothetical protein
VAELLKRDGYVINSVGNADSFDYDTTQIRATSKTPLAGERVRNDIHLAQATVTPIPDSTASASAVTPGKATTLADVVVVVGRDYVNVPTAASSPK